MFFLDQLIHEGILADISNWPRSMGWKCRGLCLTWWKIWVAVSSCPILGLSCAWNAPKFVKCQVNLIAESGGFALFLPWTFDWKDILIRWCKLVYHKTSRDTFHAKKQVKSTIILAKWKTWAELLRQHQNNHFKESKYKIKYIFGYS